MSIVDIEYRLIECIIQYGADDELTKFYARLLKEAQNAK